MFSGDGISYLESYITFQRIKILAYVLPSSITNEREDILKFFLFINIYGVINALYYFFLFFNIHFYISPYKYTKLEGDHWRSFFLFIKIYGAINAFYYYFIVLQYSSPHLSLEVRYFGGTISDSLQKVLKKFPGPVPKP